LRQTNVTAQSRAALIKLSTNVRQEKMTAFQLLEAGVGDFASK